MKEKLKKKRKRNIISYLFLAPSFCGLMIFWGIPLFIVLFYSVVNNPIEQKFVGIQNYLNVIQNPAFITAVKNTGMFSLIFVPLLVLISMGAAFLLDEKLPYRSHFRTIFLCPMMVPVASIVLVWQALFHYDGTVNLIWNRLGGESIDWFKSEYSLLVIGTLFLWKNMGYNMILFMQALGDIPSEQLDALSLETSSRWKQFYHLKLFYLSPSVFFVTILSLISSFKIFRESYLLTGNYPYGSLYMLQNFMNNTFASMDYAKLSTGAVIMLVFVILVVAFMFWGENKLGRDLEG